MGFEDIRPVLSGLIGAVAAIVIGRWLSRWLPAKINGKGADELVRENGLSVQVGNAVMAAGLIGAVAAYKWADVNSNDWRPLGVAVGLALSTPITVVPLVARLRGRSGQEAVAAYAIKQKMPLMLLYATSAVGLPLLVFSVFRSFNG